MVMVKVPEAVGVPLNRPLASRVTPPGKLPVIEKFAAGKPDAVAWKFTDWPSTMVVELALVKTGAAVTVIVNDCCTLPSRLVAVMVIGKTPLSVGVPLRTPVADRFSPVGNVPVSVIVGTGFPVATTLNDDTLDWAKVTFVPLVMIGAAPACTVRTKFCVAGVPMPLLAVIDTGIPPMSPAPGVPLITPVVALMERSAGRPDAEYVGAGKPIAA